MRRVVTHVDRTVHSLIHSARSTRTNRIGRTFHGLVRPTLVVRLRGNGSGLARLRLAPPGFARPDPEAPRPASDRAASRRRSLRLTGAGAGAVAGPDSTVCASEFAGPAVSRTAGSVSVCVLVMPRLLPCGTRRRSR
ncbi:hypothetical protein GCM10009755_11420 [Brevibacterium samyangense]|uniref:Uncharacterized protein n=1 Tax=Brevibacterium samyangense TaxID=366888 RepID=A0ABN2TD16_9MICO